MKAISHQVVQYLQPTNRTCGYTALAILLSHYGITEKPLAIAKDVAPNDYEVGSISPELAVWCRRLGLNVSFYSFDFQITDFSWRELSADNVSERLRAVKKVRNIPSLGKRMSARYVQAYIDFLAAGGELHIQPHPTTRLIYDLLKKGPIFVNVCSKVLHGTGRSVEAGLRKTKPDDVHGKVSTHSLVIYGNKTNGDLLVADPWEGRYAKTPETLLAAITAAAIECDNQLFQISKPVA